MLQVLALGVIVTFGVLGACAVSAMNSGPPGKRDPNQSIGLAVAIICGLGIAVAIILLVTVARRRK